MRPFAPSDKAVGITETHAQATALILHYINASDACCAVLKDVATFRTVYPNKVFDYMSCARPTIVAIDGVARELVEDAQAGLFVPPEGHQELAQAVLDLKAQPALAAEMGQNGRRFVEENFDRAQLAQAYARLLHGVQR